MDTNDEIAAIDFLVSQAKKRRYLIKICTRCRIQKSIAQFAATVKGYILPECRACCADRQRIWRRNTRRAWLYTARISSYRTKYGMSRAEAIEFLSNPIGLCEICRRIEKLSVDHSHKTGLVRGKLCILCNSMLGMAKDNSDILLSAIEYLERYGESLTQPPERDMILDEDQT